MTAARLEEMTGTDVLDVLGDLDVLRRIEHEIGVDVLTTTARFLTEHRGESVDGVRARLPGRQRAVRLGGAGTAEVAEFAPALVAGRLGLSAWSGARLCADVLDLEHRLPLLWASLGRYDAKAGLARFVARRTRELNAEQAALVDARVAESADGRLPWGRFITLVDATVLDVDLDATRRREEEALTEQFATATRSTVHGMRGFYIQAPFAVITRLDATVTYLADALLAQGHTGTLDERRVLAVLLLANPARALALMRLHRQTAPASSTNTAGDPGVSTSLAGARCSTTSDDGSGVSTSLAGARCSTTSGDGSGVSTSLAGARCSTTSGDGSGVSTSTTSGDDGLVVEQGAPAPDVETPDDPPDPPDPPTPLTPITRGPSAPRRGPSPVTPPHPRLRSGWATSSTRPRCCPT